MIQLILQYLLIKYKRIYEIYFLLLEHLYAC